MKTISIIVTGKVQGVFYRKSARNTGETYGLTGIVRNEEDGSVYIEATGEPGVLDRFVEWCKEGPDRAVVKDVKVSELPLKKFEGFVVQRDLL